MGEEGFSEGRQAVKQEQEEGGAGCAVRGWNRENSVERNTLQTFQAGSRYVYDL